ncbi:iron-sulfur cluster co-chaperone protein HscB isoform X2 [Erinaceus europaeus]|uniref:Iron-sulfur cluster co-chaperone protein HscB isoform X2 n=1 Tax=Erinaceus europaeus TaxID=9365 RepID=A0A1S3A5G2_ERIEU|nr:iron-sulfur cluster co-chaperone protein HscB isoform X2 [Erinaceus europaeus]
MWSCWAGTLLRGRGRCLAGVLGRRPLVCERPRCWSCGTPGGPQGRDRLFCPQCRALQPPDPARDYFSLLDCNRSFRVDTVKLQQKYQQLQRLVHPDFFMQRPQLKLQGVEIPEGTDHEVDQQFLMEIMEISEKLEEAPSVVGMEEIESAVRAKQKELTDSVSRAFEQGDFEKAKTILTKMKYFANVEEKIKLKKIPI